MNTLLLGLSCLVLVGIQGGYALRCHQCSGVSDPHFCSMVVTCASDEECHTEKVIGDDSTVFYNSGCQAKKVCQMAAKGRRSELHVCEGCCGKDLCNTELCPANNGSSSSLGVQCYQCDEVDSPADCHNRITCADGEICLVQKFLTDQVEEKFSLSCETKSRCDLLKKAGKRSTQLCNECCDTAGCNRHLCFQGNTKFTAYKRAHNSTAANSSCADLPDVDCAMLNNTMDICGQRTLAAVQYCPSFCGYCAADGSTLPPPTGSTQDPCRDSGVLDCQQMNDSLHICDKKNDPPALMYCPKFCQLCTPSAPACEDSPDVNCKQDNATNDICAKRTLEATNYCPQYCGYCVPFGSTGTTVPPPTGATEDPCRDSVDIDCQQMNDTLQICLQPNSPPTVMYCPRFCQLCKPACADSPSIDCQLANTTQSICAKRTKVATDYCSKFCGYCNADGTTNPTPPPAAGTTQDPCRDTGDVDCKQMNATLGICAQKSSPPTMLYCPKYCGIC